MPNWYCSREDVKDAASIRGASQNSTIDTIIEAESRAIDNALSRFFIPKTATKTFHWPPSNNYNPTALYLNDWLISVTTLKTKAQDSSPTTISSDDFFLEPNNVGPPYTRLEIDLSSSSSFDAGDTPQRSIEIVGSWGYNADTKSTGTVASGLSSSASATSFTCSDGSLIDVGDTLLIESEQLFVSARSNAQVGSEALTGSVAALQSTVTVPVTTGSNWSVGEIIQVNSEKMLIESISSNNLTVQRAYDGSVLAAHSSSDQVHGFRVLTVQRGINGTTAATHANATAISVYTIPQDVRLLAIRSAISTFYQIESGDSRAVADDLGRYRDMVLHSYGTGRLKPVKVGAI
jgi:hypothetical protein